MMNVKKARHSKITKAVGLKKKIDQIAVKVFFLRDQDKTIK